MAPEVRSSNSKEEALGGIEAEITVSSAKGLLALGKAPGSPATSNGGLDTAREQTLERYSNLALVSIFFCS